MENILPSPKADVKCPPGNLNQIGEESARQKMSYTEEEKKELIMDVYYPHIIQKVRSTDILPHLIFLQDQFNELRMLDENGKHVDSMIMLLSHLNFNEHPEKWTLFVDVLKITGYEVIYRALEYGEPICTNEHDTQYNLIVSSLPTLIKRIRLDNSGILPMLYQHKVISENNLERIRAYIRHHSNQDAILELIQHLHRKTKEWYTVFLEALLQDGYSELVTEFDPLFISSRKSDMKYNFDSLDYEEDYLSVDGEAVVDGVCEGGIESDSRGSQDRTNGASSDNESSPSPEPAQEVIFPSYPTCPQMDEIDEDIGLVTKLFSLASVKVNDVRFGARRALRKVPCWKKLQDQLQCWKIHYFKDWCDKMGNYFEIHDDIIQSRKVLVYYVEKWLSHVEDCLQNECGEMDICNSEIEAWTELLEDGTFRTFIPRSTFLQEIEDAKDRKKEQCIIGKERLQKMRYMIIQIKNDKQNCIADFQYLDHSEELIVIGINGGKVLKDIGQMWTNLA